MVCCMKETNEKKLVVHFLAGVAVFLGGMALLVILIDPFFHYHKPWFGLKPLQTSHQYQGYGAVKHLEYDSLLLGSSVVMSINTDTLDGRLGSATIKAVGNSAAAPLLAAYLDIAFEEHELKQVYYGLDVFSLYSGQEENPFPEEVDYMVNKNPFDDVSYFWNGDVIFEKIPDMLSVSRFDNFTWGLAYQINDKNECGPEYVLQSYNPLKDIGEHEAHDELYGYDEVEANLTRIEAFVQKHPDTRFEFFLPPYCITWWYRADNQNLLESYFYTLERAMERLLPYENVRFFTTDFNNPEIITNLYLYQDVAHGGTVVTERMAAEIGNPEYEITLETYQKELGDLRKLLEAFEVKTETEGIEFVYDGPIECLE